MIHSKLGPVLASDSETYEREFIEAWIAAKVLTLTLTLTLSDVHSPTLHTSITLTLYGSLYHHIQPQVALWDPA